MVRLTPLTAPAKVAVPAVLVIEIRPVVVNEAILCAVVTPAKVIGELPAVNAPLFVKLPANVIPKFPVARVPPELMFNGEVPSTAMLPITLASLSVIIPDAEPLMIIPPDAVNGVGQNDVVTVLLADPMLYCKVAADP